MLIMAFSFHLLFLLSLVISTVKCKIDFKRTEARRGTELTRFVFDTDIPECASRLFLTVRDISNIDSGKQKWDIAVRDKQTGDEYFTISLDSTIYFPLMFSAGPALGILSGNFAIDFYKWGALRFSAEDFGEERQTEFQRQLDSASQEEIVISVEKRFPDTFKHFQVHISYLFGFDPS